MLYRASGVVMINMSEGSDLPDLFGEYIEIDKFDSIYASVDEIKNKYGKHTIFLGSSYQAVLSPVENLRDAKPDRHSKYLLKGESKRRRLDIPWLGFVK